MAYRHPRDLADSMARRRKTAAADDGYVRESFTQDREEARRTARDFLDRGQRRLTCPPSIPGASSPATGSSSR